MPILFLRPVPALALLVLLFGCSRSVRVAGEFPSPVVEPLPLTVGVYCSPELRSFVYERVKGDGVKWSVALGQAQTRLFERLFAALFEQTVSVGRAAGALGLDAVIEPRLEEFTLSLPIETGSRFQEVRIRYVLDLYDRGGELVSSWSIEGYGRDRPGWAEAGESADRATTLALRDVAAGLIIGLAERPEIRRLVRRSLVGPEQAADHGTL